LGDSGCTSHRGWQLVFQVQLLPPGHTMAAQGSPHADARGDRSGGTVDVRQPASPATMTNARTARFMLNE
jgi:hypothetical protein